MNEVEIVVTSNDRTDFSAIASKAKSSVKKSMDESIKAADKQASKGFEEIGQHSGDALSEGLSGGFGSHKQRILQDLKKGFDKAGEDVGKTVAKGAERGFSNLVKTGLNSTKKLATGMVSQLGTAAKTIGGSGVLGAVAAGIILLPEIASVAGGGIALGLGAGLAAVGIKAQLSNKQVRDSFAQTKSYVVSQVKQISAPFNNTLLSLSKNAQKAFYDIQPAVKSAFDSIAPAITNFGNSAEKSIGKWGPAIKSIGSGFSAVLNSLGSKLPSIMNNFATSIKAVTDAVAANPEAFTNLVENTSKLARVTGDGIGILIRYTDAVTGLSGTYNALKDTVTGSGHALQIGSGEFASFSQQAALAAGKTNGFMTAQQAATLTSQQLATALASLTSATQGAFDAETSYGQALSSANARAKQTSAGISNMTNAGRQNRLMLSNLAKAIKNVETTSHPTAAAIDHMRSNFVAAARGMGLSKNAAQALATKLLGVTRATNSIPKSHNTKLTNNAAAARAAVQAYQNKLDSLHGKTVYVHTVYTSSGSRTFGAGNKKLGDAHGGVIGTAATGGVRNNMVLVGEQGPELVDLAPGSHVRSNPDTNHKMARAGSGGDVNVTLTVVGGESEFQRFLAAMIKKYVRVTAGSGPNSVQTAYGR